MVRFAVCCHPRKASLKRGVTLWINQARTIAPDGSGTVPDRHFRRRRGFLRTLTTQNFRINKTFTTDATVSAFSGVSSPGARETVRHGESPTCGHGGDSVCHRGRGDGDLSTRFSWTPAPFPGTRVVGTLSESSSLRTYITLTLPLLPLFHRSCFSPPALREARRLPEAARFAMISYQSLRLSYLLNKQIVVWNNVPDNM